MNERRGLPDYVQLRPNEQVRAVIAQDRQVGLLTESLAAVAGLFLFLSVPVIYMWMIGQPIGAMHSSGMTGILITALAPVAVGRIWRRRVVYVLTDQRVIFGARDAVELRNITRIRVGFTRVVLLQGKARHALSDLIHPSAVAHLIRDCVAKGRV